MNSLFFPFVPVVVLLLLTHTHFLFLLLVLGTWSIVPVLYLFLSPLSLPESGSYDAVLEGCTRVIYFPLTLCGVVLVSGIKYLKMKLIFPRWWAVV